MGLTIYDIATKVGVSTATVSLALRRDERVAERTARKVLRVANKLGYRPSFAGRSLSTRSTQSVGIVVPDFTNPHHARYVHEFEKLCRARGYRLVAMEYDSNPQLERRCLEEILSRRCDGIVTWVSYFAGVRDLYAEAWSRHIPWVVLGLPLDALDTQVDGTVGGDPSPFEMVAEHLAAHGHTRIALLGCFPPGYSERIDVPIFRKALERTGIEEGCIVLTRFSGNDARDGYDMAEELLKAHPQVTAIWGINDVVCTGVLRRLAEAGRSVPDDVSVVGMDNTWLAEYLPVPLTSVGPDYADNARWATEVLFSRLASDDWSAPLRRKTPYELAVRKSTGPARQG